MKKERVEAFSDGVLAVAITLLVLDLHIDVSKDHASVPHQFGTDWPSYVAYVVSFFVIGIIWVNHHSLFSLISQVDRVLEFQNLLLLMFVTSMPFTTATLASLLRGGGSDARWGVALYGISNIGMAVAFTMMLARMVHRGLLTVPVSPEVGTAAIRRFGIGTVVYPLATGLGLLWPPAILITMGALAIYYMTEQTQILPTGVAGSEADQRTVE